ncbi:PREDICTED: calponin homology domain-containing protein DDB_G0272472-like [Trachymyrmex cornetzi]|uniref:calponin homology domain-containing protein DDB_G0272472-like n=1 Tax=Trachymyrmex cornetzi TaxID=471704 RepID=UPI00084F4D7C|nr:PREDICTED: calponin homology domain-containing protein DDB_G0272472-like [Trachymyrmex cornetzi]
MDIEKEDSEASNKEVTEKVRSSKEQLGQPKHIEDLSQDLDTKVHKEGKILATPIVRVERQALGQGAGGSGGSISQPSTSSFFRKPGPKSYKGRTRGSQSRDSSVETETFEISSSDSDVSEYRRKKGRSTTIEDDSDESPPEKVNIGSKGPQRIPGSRKRERTTSDADSDRRKSWTTGEYVGRREAILRYNEAKEESLNLDREKLVREYGDADLFKKARIDMAKVKESLEEKSIEELMKQANDNCAEVLRIARSSSNLKGTFQKSLKVAAATSLGIVDILKEKTTLSKEEAKSLEIRSLRKEISRLKLKMEDEIEKERRKALQAAGEAEAYRSELQAIKDNLVKRKDKTPSPKSKDKDQYRGKSSLKSSPETSKKSTSRRTPSENIKARDKLITSESEGMEVDESSPRLKKVTLDDPKKWPEVRRPTLSGKQKIIEEDPTSQRAIYEAHIKYMSDSHKESGEKYQPNKEGNEEALKNRKSISV